MRPSEPQVNAAQGSGASPRDVLRFSTDGRLAYTAAEAARLLSVSAATMYRLLEQRVVHAKKVGTKWIVPVWVIEEILTDASDLPLTPPSPK